MTPPRLLITGCRGLVGRILWANLEKDFDLYGLDISPGEPSKRVIQADISKIEQVQAVFQHISPLTYVVHLAGDPRAEADWFS